ncbi:type VI secretion system tube protein TssD [Phocaeicola dorei]|uniref:type VI secretion system tube protein TssD n=1 Tax=Phocaeicola dorei TaxID=357276 RepID=UPI0039B5D361
MIYETILKIRGMEVPILYYNYRCHIRHYDDPNLRKIIQLHIQVCEEIGNRECLPVEGDLITLAFECKGEEQFFYDWLNEGAMHNGEIHFIYNEVEIADIFRFWDCFCVKIEEYMSVGNSPMMMVLYLSPGIIKRNNLEVREKVWKVSDVAQQTVVQVTSESKEEKQPEIVEVYWKDKKDEIIKIIPDDGIVTLYAKTKNTNAGDILSFSIVLEDGATMIKIDNCVIDSNGIAKVSNFDLKQYKHTFNI